MAAKRKALIVGIDYYDHCKALHGCVNDATQVNDVLSRHGDRSRNFDALLLSAASEDTAVSKKELRTAIKELFEFNGEVALLYFAGHGHLESEGSYILASDSEDASDSISLANILQWANDGRAHNRIVILDSCHSGMAGASATNRRISEIAEGTTILTASTAEQYADEENGCGIFTGLLVDALGGAAANLLGDVTPGAIYAHIDQSLGSWEQRPVFKTNTQEFVSLRNVSAKFAVDEIHQLTDLFDTATSHHALNPSYEREMSGRPEGAPGPNWENVRKFELLQKYRSSALVDPVDAPHMWHAAMESKACELTALGRHYWRLVNKGLI